MPIDRPHRWFAVSCGLLLMVSTVGCRSTRSRIPPQPQAGLGRQTPQVQLSTEPSPPTNAAQMPLYANMNQGGASGPVGAGMMGSNSRLNPASGANPMDVPTTGLGTPASGVSPTSPSGAAAIPSGAPAATPDVLMPGSAPAAGDRAAGGNP
jgi:hypothetical protein